MNNKLIVANFKMNVTSAEVKTLLTEYNEKINRIIAVCVPFPYFHLFNQLNSNNKIALGAQNVSQFDMGAYTGEVSSKMLADFNVKYCIVGHAERRINNAENTMQCYEKIKLLLNYNITPILCVGENEKQHEQGQTLKIVKKQVAGALKRLNISDIKKVIIAYEPVWAIQNRTQLDAAEANRIASEIINTVRKLVKDNSNAKVLYGGYVTKNNANAYLQMSHIDGLLVGKESLNAENFVELCKNS